MTSIKHDFRLVVTRELLRRAGPDADAHSLSGAASSAYDDLTVVIVPMVGQVGFDALTKRALNLAQSEYPTGRTDDIETSDSRFARVSKWLERLDPAHTNDAAVTMLFKLGNLLVTFIGEPLTMRLVKKAWPESVSEGRVEETPV